jgi:hypothetical protein
VKDSRNWAVDTGRNKTRVIAKTRLPFQLIVTKKEK